MDQTENEEVQKISLQEVTNEKPHILKKFPSSGMVSKVREKTTLFVILGSIFAVLAGVSTGWFMSGGSMKKTEIDSKTKQVNSTVLTEMGEVKEGLDEAEGKLVEGGIEGEGNYHLEREGGPSKYVYLTSTVIDLQSFVGKKVKVWGETTSAVKAPWLMDVFKVKTLE